MSAVETKHNHLACPGCQENSLELSRLRGVESKARELAGMESPSVAHLLRSRGYNYEASVVEALVALLDAKGEGNG